MRTKKKDESECACHKSQRLKKVQRHQAFTMPKPKSVKKTKTRKEHIWHIVELIHDKKVVSVPKSWIAAGAQKLKSGQKASTNWIYWTTELPESKLVQMAMNEQPYGKSWTLHAVEILATASKHLIT